MCEASIDQLKIASESISISGTVYRFLINTVDYLYYVQLFADLKIVKNAGDVVSESYGVSKFPSLVFYRRGYPALYHGMLFRYL